MRRSWRTTRRSSSLRRPAREADEGLPIAGLRVDAEVAPQPARRSEPITVDVRLTNDGAEPVLVNGRLAVGYRESDARELFAELFRPGSAEVVSPPAKFYERDLAGPEDYVSLEPGESLSTSFDLRDWLRLPEAGKYELVVSYQADEALAQRPDGLLPGVHSSERVPFTLVG